MEEMINLASPVLVEAVRIWSGKDLFSWPHPDGARVKLRLGADAAEGLLPVIMKLTSDFYSTDAHLKTGDLTEMGRLAREHFKRLHPDAAEEIAEIIEWCYTFDNR
jgi:hypothetical protein